MTFSKEQQYFEMRLAAFCAKAGLNDAIRPPAALIVVFDLCSVNHFFDLVPIFRYGSVDFFKSILQIAEHVLKIDGIQLIHFVLKII